MSRSSPRGLLAVIAAMALALLASAYGLMQLKSTVDTNAATIRQFAATVAGEQQTAAAQLLLIQALQQQVRDLGGQPLTTPPSPRTTPQNPARPTGSGASSRPSPAPSRSSRPTPRPTPTGSPSPSPHPSSSVCPIPSSPNVCLPPPASDPRWSDATALREVRSLLRR